MATYTGKQGSIKVGGTAVAEVSDFTLNISAETVDDTVKGDDWRTKKATFKTWGGSLKTQWDPTDSGQGNIDVGSTVAVELYPGDATTGETYYSGNAIITEMEISSELDGMVEAAASFEGSGACTEATVA